MRFYRLISFTILLSLSTPFSCNADIRTQPLQRTAHDLALLYIGAISLYLISSFPIILCHELGHKYTAKVLTGADSTIKVGFFSGATGFDKENWQLLERSPKKRILMLLAGPLTGCLGALGMYYIGSHYFEKNSQLHAMSLSALAGAIAQELSNFWPDQKNDGALILEAIKQIQEGNIDTKSPLKKLADTPGIDKFALIKKLTQDPMDLSDKQVIAAPAA